MIKVQGFMEDFEVNQGLWYLQLQGFKEVKGLNLALGYNEVLEA